MLRSKARASCTSLLYLCRLMSEMAPGVRISSPTHSVVLGNPIVPSSCHSLRHNEIQEYEKACVVALQKLSKRQKLRHALACQRLGLEAPEVERPVPSADIEAESEPFSGCPLPSILLYDCQACLVMRGWILFASLCL